MACLSVSTSRSATRGRNLNGSLNGNGLLFGINIQIDNDVIGINNGSQRQWPLGINTQVDNEFIGFNNGSQTATPAKAATLAADC